MNNFRRDPTILDKLGWYIGKVKLIAGVATLGVATTILTISHSRATYRNQDALLRVVPLMLAAFGFLFISHRSKPRSRKP